MNTILTGLRANDDLHLGNYLGAVLPMVELQKSLTGGDKLYMFVPDLHSFTTPVDHDSLYRNSLENVRVFLASGIDPGNAQTVLYRQSLIPAHSEMAWILSCFTYFGEASRMTEFKDKSEKLGNKGVTVGLFDYPVLMAADILLYNADYVPVGDDQKQHMELARTLAERMNNKFGELFVVPKAWKQQLEYSDRDVSVRIRSLSHPENKMSKSIDDPKGTILLTDEPELAAKKIMSAQTDDKANISLDFETQPGISNLLQILALLDGKTTQEVADEWSGSGEYGKLKERVADVVSQFLAGLQERLEQIELGDVEQILVRGEEVATVAANEKLLQVQKAVGLRK